MDSHALKCYREAGAIARDAKLLAASMIKPGARLVDVMEAAEDFIKSKNAGIAFPAQTSRNHIAAHYCPGINDMTTYAAEDVVKVDIGVEVDGYIADNAMSIYLGDNPHYQKMVTASAAALESAISLARPGVNINEISKAIEKTIEDHSFRPVYNLTGHGVDRWKVHCKPSIPAAPDRWNKATLEPGMVVAIEPFATDGKGTVHEKGKSEIFMLTHPPKKFKGIDEQVWETIESMRGLPFARRTFKNIKPDTIESSLSRLVRMGCLMNFPPLVDPNPNTRITQCEHTLIVQEDVTEVITA